MEFYRKCAGTFAILHLIIIHTFIANKHYIIVIHYFIIYLTFSLQIFKTLLRVFLLNLKGGFISLRKHCLIFLFRIRFKILVLTFQAYHEVALDYLCELITKHHAVRTLRSNDMMLFDESKISCKMSYYVKHNYTT